MGSNQYGIDPDTVRRLASDLAEAQAEGVQVAVVVGGGNIVRGEGLEAAGIDPEEYEGRTVRTRGWVKSYNGPMIEATHPEQIEVLAP